MAYHGVRGPREAVARLSEATAASTRPAPGFWDAEALRLLRREAERLILDPAFPDDPFAP